MSRDEGSAAVEFVWISLLLVVPFVYVMLAVFDTQRAAYAVSTASRSAARAFLQAPDVPTGQARARLAARLALDDQGVAGLRLDIACLPSRASCLQPGSSVRVQVTTTQILPLVPSALGSGLGGVTVDSTHTEPYGTFRSER